MRLEEQGIQTCTKERIGGATHEQFDVVLSGWNLFGGTNAQCKEENNARGTLKSWPLSFFKMNNCNRLSHYDPWG